MPSPGPLAPGDEVTVYEDPISEENEEGTAILIRCLEEKEEGLSYWKVRFPGDPPEYVERWIFRPMQGKRTTIPTGEPGDG